MSRPLIGWMVFQILVGIWLFISPFVLGFSTVSSAATTNTMIFGAVVGLMGIGLSVYNKEACSMEDLPHKA